MATEIDVSKSRRFDIAMSRRTRRSTSLVGCFQDQYTPSQAQHHHQELKAFLQCQEEELKAVQQCDDAEQKTLCPSEDEETKIPQLQCEDDEQKTPEQNEDEQEKELQRYPDEEQEIPDPFQDNEKKPDQYLDEEKMPEQYQDEDELPSEYQDQELVTSNLPEEDKKETARELFQNVEVELVTPDLPEEGEETASERFQGVEQKEDQEHQEADEQVSQPEDEEKQKSSQECHGIKQKAPEQFQASMKLALPPRLADNVPRFSLQELIQQKQLPTGEAMPTSKLGNRGESVLADHKVSGSGATAGGTTLAMVIKRPEGGKKSMGMIRRCVKALNQMIKAKHGSKKNLHF